MSKVEGKEIMNDKKTVNSDIESSPIFFDPINCSINNPIFELNTQSKGKINQKNINYIYINNLRNKQYSKKNINQNNRI